MALFCSLLFGSIPALRYAGTRVGTGLRESRTTSQGRERHRTRNILVVIQVSLAFVLLICSGLMIRTFRALIHVDAGYDTAAKIQTVRLGIPEADVPKDDDVLRMQQAIAQKIAAVPGVESVSFGGSVPMDGNGWHDPVYAQDRKLCGRRHAAVARIRVRRSGISEDAWHSPGCGARLHVGRDSSRSCPLAL